jgi:uncharacterized DUF497 family protein
MRYNEEFEWSEQKNIINQEKHSVCFEEAFTIWYSLYALDFYDEAHSELEDRYIKIGISQEARLLVVIYCVTPDSNKTRIISARKATKKETYEYEKRI